MAKSWISFQGPATSRSGKTKVWQVSTGGFIDNVLGEIRWHAPWRRYAFFPEAYTLYEHDCLREIATFCEAQTAEHKRKGAPK